MTDERPAPTTLSGWLVRLLPPGLALGMRGLDYETGDREDGLGLSAERPRAMLFTLTRERDGATMQRLIADDEMEDDPAAQARALLDDVARVFMAHPPRSRGPME